jgi:hypothetical protein
MLALRLRRQPQLNRMRLSRCARPLRASPPRLPAAALAASAPEPNQARAQAQARTWGL